MDSAAFVT